MHTVISSILILLLWSSLAFGSDGSGTLEVITCPVIHGEGPHWDSDIQCLYYVDITNQTVNKYDPKTRQTHQVHIDGGPISPVIPVEFTTDEFVVGRGLDLVWIKWDGISETPSKTKVLTSVDKKRPLNRFNDGKADSSGRLWAGTMGPENPNLVLNQGSLYSFEPYDNFSPVVQVSNVSVSNGIAWNAHDTVMYYVDSPSRKIYMYDFDIVRGKISNQRTLFDLEEHKIPGVPDGMTIDHYDNLWVAIFNGGRVINIDTQKSALIKTVMLPVTKVTSCSFGEPNLDTLFITTSRVGLTKEEVDKQPQAGSVFTFKDNDLKGQNKKNKIRVFNMQLDKIR